MSKKQSKKSNQNDLHTPRHALLFIHGLREGRTMKIDAKKALPGSERIATYAVRTSQSRHGRGLICRL